MRSTRLFVLSAIGLAASQAFAQTPPSAEAGDTMTIVITARRVDERLIDVPLSVKAISGASLTERGITSLSELSQFTPGMSFSPDLGRVSERPVVRGISALRPEAPQPVSVFVDGIYLRDGTLGLLLDDVQRVEIIKGPQSALYGRATYAGAINYITVKPGDKVGGTAGATFGQAGEAQVFGAVTVPLMGDKLSMRVKAKTQKYGGQYINELTGNPIGSESTDIAGLQVVFRPTANLDARLSVDYSSERDGMFNATVRTIPTQAAGVVTNQNGSSNVANGTVCNGRTINIVGNNAVTGLPDANVPPTAAARANGWPCGAATFTGTTVRRNEADLANYTNPANGENFGNIAGSDRTITRTGLTVEYEFGGGYVLTSQTGITRQRSSIGADQSYNGTRFAITGASWLSYNRDQADYWSQEFRLASPQDQALTWLGGVFVYDEQNEGQGTGVITRNAQGQVLPDVMRPGAGRNVKNASPFGRVQYEFNKDLRVSLEGRYNRETVEIVGTPQGLTLTTAGSCVAGQQCVVQASKTFTDFSPRLTLDYKPMKDLLLYGQAATGSKSGGYNTAAGIPAGQFEFKGEKIRSVELGVKGQFAGGAAGLSAALFRNDVQDLQLSNLIVITNPFSATGATTTTTIVNNIGKARTQGLELDGYVKLMSRVTLSANYAFTDAKVLEGTEVTNGTAFGGNQSVAGFTLPRTPKHSAAVSLAADSPTFGNGLSLNGRVDVVYQTRRYAEIQNLIWADPYTRVNVTAGIKGKDWRLSLWVKNATNDDTSINGFRYLDPVTFRRSAVDFLPRLRQAGATLGIDF